MTMPSGQKDTWKVAIMAAGSRFVGITHRGLDWMGYLARRRVTIYIIAIGVAVYGVVLRCSGLGRSLWLDEAWVANSVAAPSLRGMFFYDAWLQSSPPLFLMLVRVPVALFGLSNIGFRAIPLLMGILAILSMLLFAARILSRQYALLAWTLLVLSPIAIDYSRELKQYSSELAASATILLVCTLYIENATVRRFWLLVGTVVAGLLIAYSVAFVLPGLILVICMTPIRHCTSSNVSASRSKRFVRASLLAVAAGGTLIGEDLLLVAPNSPAVLRASWAKKNIGVDSARLAASDGYRLIRELPLNHLLRRQGFLLSAVGVTIILGVFLAWLRFRKGRRKWLAMQVLCLPPCLLLIVSDRFSWYPFTERTGLFALPFVIVLVVSSLQLASLFVLQRGRSWVRPLLDVVFLCAIIVTINAGRRTHLTHLNGPREDMDGAVSFLRAHVQPADFLWVHASCLEAFKLYTRMDGWPDAPAYHGHTGWPCCARGISNTSDTFGEQLVRNDFGSALPIGFRGRVWILYTMRPEHWQGRPNEPQIMQTILQERGCVEMPTPFFVNVSVSSFDCKAHAAIAPVAYDP
jgi:4-amino-4-deoxy-L-arabinose transferase-like glycosyltransferase